jgi:hypothetical protein
MTWTSDYGAQRVCLKGPTCVVTERARTHLLLRSVVVYSVSLTSSPCFERSCCLRFITSIMSIETVCPVFVQITVKTVGSVRINAIFRRVSDVWQLSPWKTNKCNMFWVCVCGLSYPACKAHAPCYMIICGLCGSAVFFHIIHKHHDFREKMLLNVKCVLIFCTTLERFSFWEELSEIFS